MAMLHNDPSFNIENSDKIALVTVARGVPTMYTYRVPAQLESELQLGSPVTVPLGHSKCAGTVMMFSDESPKAPLKEIVDIDPKRPILKPMTIALIGWFQQYYQTTPFKALQTVLGNRKHRLVPEETEASPEFNTPFPLTESQLNAISIILDNQKTQQYLLHGVTGSGKTEIYIQLAAAMQKKNKQTLILVPEIALTPQYTALFTSRFGHRLTVIHSGLTPKNRDLAWNAIQQNQVDIVIGPRSAAFSPFDSLGLIIVDEEHEPSYKQDTHPRYDAHHIVQFLSQQHQAKIVLGSATPRLETLYRALETQEITYIPLKDRATGVPLPDVHIIDMKEELRLSPSIVLSRAFHAQITQTLSEKKKVMILLNRRGFATTIVCQICKKLLTCPNCQLSYTYHSDKKLRCHRCDTQMPITNTCPHCQKHSLHFTGLGIQKVALHLQEQFPDATIMRMDKDTVKTVTDVDAMLTQFKSEGDILIGTQLIAKGHDIPSVNLVGIIGIDTTLNLPDFRSSERTFQLLTQVAGRAGRAQEKGQVYVHTLQPEHYVFQFAQTHDALGFFNTETQFRNTLTYPPYCMLINIIISSHSKFAAKEHGNTLHQALTQKLETCTARIMPLKPCPFEQIRNHFRFHIVIKLPPDENEHIKSVIQELPKPDKNTRVIVDFDAWQLL